MVSIMFLKINQCIFSYTLPRPVSTKIQNDGASYTLIHTSYIAQLHYHTSIP